MKQTIFSLGAIALVSLGALLACNSEKQPSANKEGLVVAGATAESDEALITRGRYLVTIMGCNDCHSPKVMTPQGPALDSAHLLAGHLAKMPLAKIETKQLKDWVLFNMTQTAYVGPWGVSYAANISSGDAGIGNWTEEQFFRAMREGKYKGMANGRPLLPPMPWQQFRNATDEDLRAMFRYLKSTPAQDNVVPAPVAPNMIEMAP